MEKIMLNRYIPLAVLVLALQDVRVGKVGNRRDEQPVPYAVREALVSLMALRAWVGKPRTLWGRLVVRWLDWQTSRLERIDRQYGNVITFYTTADEVREIMEIINNANITG